MRNILLTLSIFFFAFSALFGQEQKEGTPTRFKGVEIMRPLDEVVSLLKIKGLKDDSSEDARQIYRENDMIKLVGDVSGYHKCDVALKYTNLNDTDVVELVHINFPNCDNWKDLYTNYTSIRNALIEKYNMTFQEIDNVAGQTEDLISIRNNKALNAIREGNVSLESFMVNQFDNYAMKVLVSHLAYDDSFKIALIYYTPIALLKEITKYDDL